MVEKTHRKRGRVVFFAVAIAVAMVAMAVGFAAPAAAEPIDRTPNSTTIDAGESVDIEITVDVDEGDELLTYEEEIPDGLTVSDVDANSGAVDSERVDDNEVLVFYAFSETEDTITFTVTADENIEGESFDLSGVMITDQEELETTVTSVTVAPPIDRTPANTTIDVGESADIEIDVEAGDGNEILTYDEQIPDGLTVSDVDANSGAVDSELVDDNEVLVLYTFSETEDTITFTVTADEGANGESFDLSGTLITDQNEFETAVTSITVEDTGASRYEDNEGDVGTDGLREAINDWRQDDSVDTDLLREVINKWRTN